MLPTWLVTPFRQSNDPQAPTKAADEASQRPQETLALLEEHGLALIWSHALDRLGVRPQGPLASALRDARRKAAMSELAQRAASKRAGKALDQAQIAYVAFKGAHLCRTIYASPELRPSLDIDLLVRAHERDDAISALVEAGFEGLGGIKDISHELNLTDGHAHIDLHWHLTRPGRARIALADEVVARRQRLDDLWVPSAADALAILLFHPALSDQVSARLVRAVDLALFSARYPEAWEDALDLLERAGLRTAAWATLIWAQSQVSMHPPPDALGRLAPHFAHQAYLRRWIEADPGALYARHPLLVRAGFNLALSDGWLGALRALAALRSAKRSAREERERIDQLLVPRKPNVRR